MKYEVSSKRWEVLNCLSFLPPTSYFILLIHSIEAYHLMFNSPNLLNAYIIAVTCIL